MHVSQAAFALLQLRLEQVRHLAEPVMPEAGRLGERANPPLGFALPGLAGAPREVVAEIGIARDRARVEQAQRGLEIAPGHPEGFVDGLDAVVERDALFPDRVPHAARELFDVAAVPVQEHHVEVASRRELRTAVAAHRHQRDIGLVAEEVGQPTIREARQSLAESQAPEGLVGKDRLAFFTKSRRGPSRRCGHG